jgi:tetratricopeptide (TPR) repeat protein
MNDEEAAVATLAKARVAGPDSPYVHLMDARLAARSQRWDEASEAAQRAVDDGPDILEAYHALSEYQLRAGRPDQARSTLERLAELTPSDPLVFLALGDVCTGLESWECATVSFRTVVSLSGSREIGYLHLGGVLEDTLGNADALANYALCVERVTGAYECWYRRVRLLEQWSAAAPTPEQRSEKRSELLLEVRAMGHAVAREPAVARQLAWRLVALEDGELLETFVAGCYARRSALVELQYHVGVLHERRGSLNTAAEAWALVPAASSFYVESRSRLAVLRSRQGRGKASVRALREAIAIRPEMPELYLLLATVYEEGGSVKRARRALAEGIARRGDAAPLWGAEARLARGVGDLEGALTAARKTYELDPQDSDNGVFLAGVLAELGRDLAFARTLVEAALVTAGERDPTYVATLARVLLRAGEPAEAVRLFEEADGLGPLDALQLARLGDAYLAVGRGQDATSAWTRGHQDPEAGRRLRRALARKLRRRR